MRGRSLSPVAEARIEGLLIGLADRARRRGDQLGQVTDMHLLVLTSRDFSALIDEFPSVARRIMAALAGRVREAEARQPLAPHLKASR